MKPIGLACKSNGELMVVHLCLNCHKISGNRIAGDDNSYAVSCLLEEPGNLSEDIRSGLLNRGIRLLTQDDKQIVSDALYGYNY
jgi:hypothetical protein